MYIGEILNKLSRLHIHIHSFIDIHAHICVKIVEEERSHTRGSRADTRVEGSEEEVK